ncbi:TetR/AcrR family transcriptional regulator [Streptomyces cacaoi]|uniref:TetR/AcrR family transcriptional regulator n=1 Tax=Streptomyces cacaoi TaxID=1898 RepID=UPI00262AB34E|nr:TetR/AcrR family transcriptional regulator [Streptomyces cacaoi]
MHERRPEPTRRELLLAAGRDAFGRMPYDEVSLSEVAQEAGVAHGLPFHYFKNKRGFFIEVVRSLAEEMRIAYDDLNGLPHGEALRAAINRHIDYFEQRPHVLLGPIRSNLVTDSRVRDVFEETRWDGALAVLRLIGIDEPTEGIRLLMRSWLAFHDELLVQWILERPVPRPALVEVLVAGLTSILGSVTLLEAGTGPDLSALHEQTA